MKTNRNGAQPGPWTDSPWLGLLTLALIPFYVLWAVWVLVPYWMVQGFIRYYRAPLKVRQRRWRIEHSNRTRYFDKYERDTVELLRRRGLLDTTENRAKLRRR